MINKILSNIFMGPFIDSQIMSGASTRWLKKNAFSSAIP